jgi:hypothetical protein
MATPKRKANHIERRDEPVTRYRCSVCLGNRVQIQMPVWCHPDSLEPEDVDCEAEYLATW